MLDFSQLVENLWKTSCKSLRKSITKLCAKLSYSTKFTKSHIVPQLFPLQPAHYSTAFLPLSPPNLFHFSTAPTITTTTKLIINKITRKD